MGLTSIANGFADLAFATKRKVLGRHRVRRTRLYCVGTGKSGTHSIGGMFSKTVRAKHEPEATQFIAKFLAWKRGAMEETQFTRWLLERDRRLALEVDSSWLNRHILDILLREFPEARFILTIRDCYSWCDSLLNHRIRFSDKADPLWKQMGEWMHPEKFQHAPEERPLKELGFHTLDCYFSHWARHNSGVLECVPAERLLVVRTDEIGRRAFEIADFAGLPRRTVLVQRTHEFKNPAKTPILAQIDPDFLEASVERHCRPLMSRFFPEIKSLADTKVQCNGRPARVE